MNNNAHCTHGLLLLTRVKDFTSTKALIGPWAQYDENNKEKV